MIAIMWYFEVRPGREADFETFYGADGAWTAVSRNSRSYLGSSFLRDQNQPSRYVVVEYWSEAIVYEEHKAYNTETMRDLGAQRDELVETWEPLGVFTALNVPDRSGPTWSRRS